MKKLHIACITLALFVAFSNEMLASQRFDDKKNEDKNRASSSVDSIFVVSEVDLSVLKIPPRFENQVYQLRLDSLTKDIPLDYNGYVQAYIDLYAFRKRDQVERMLGLSEYYFPMVEKVFRERDIPTEFKYLAIVESALNPYAVSRVGATGMWQFMFTTGKMYGLKITSHIDERRDPYKATVAAAQYFVDMYRRYGDWLLVIAAYNCGPGNVNKAIRKAGGAKDFWSIRQYLPQETRGYVPAYIAATYIMNYSEEHNLFPSYPNFSFMTDTIHISRPVSFKDVEDLCGVSADELRILNPLFKKDFIPAYDETFVLKVPSTRRDIVCMNIDSLYRSFPTDMNNEPVFVLTSDPMSKSGSFSKYHEVKQGETLSRIAAKYDVTLTDLRKWNNMSSNMVRTGQKLKIKKESPAVIEQPQTVYAQNSTSPNAPAQEYDKVVKSKTKTHKVKYGENLTLIAKKYGVEISDLKDWNNLRSTNIQIGQVIKIKTTEVVLVARKAPAPPVKETPVAAAKEEQLAQSGSAAPESKDGAKTINANDEVEIVKVPVTITHQVKRGETLTQISQKYAVSIDDLKSWNTLQASHIMVDQKLIIKREEEKIVVKKSASAEQLATKKIPARAEDGQYVLHKVEAGDTLWNIAKRYEGVTVEMIRTMNGLKTDDAIKTGTVLKVIKKG